MRTTPQMLADRPEPGASPAPPGERDPRAEAIKSHRDTLDGRLAGLRRAKGSGALPDGMTEKQLELDIASLEAQIAGLERAIAAHKARPRGPLGPMRR